MSVQVPMTNDVDYNNYTDRGTNGQGLKDFTSWPIVNLIQNVMIVGPIPKNVVNCLIKGENNC